MAELEEVVLAGQDDNFDFDPTLIDSFDLGVADFRDQDCLQYPAVLLSRVLFTDCLRVLKSRKRTSYREMDAWVEMPDDGGYHKVGTIQLDSDMLLTLRYLRIGVTLYLDSENIRVLDLENPDVLQEFL